MKKFFLATICCLFTLALVAQDTPAEKEREKVQIDVEKIELELEQAMKELAEELEDIDIDLSGLEALNDIDWKAHVEDSEALAYLESEEFKQEMARVQEEVNVAMAEMKVELQALKEIEWEKIEAEVKQAMEEAERAIRKERHSDAY